MILKMCIENLHHSFEKLYGAPTSQWNVVGIVFSHLKLNGHVLLLAPENKRARVSFLMHHFPPTFTDILTRNSKAHTGLHINIGLKFAPK